MVALRVTCTSGSTVCAVRGSIETAVPLTVYLIYCHSPYLQQQLPAAAASERSWVVWRRRGAACWWFQFIDSCLRLYVCVCVWSLNWSNWSLCRHCHARFYGAALLRAVYATAVSVARYYTFLSRVSQRAVHAERSIVMADPSVWPMPVFRDVNNAGSFKA